MYHERGKFKGSEQQKMVWTGLKITLRWAYFYHYPNCTDNSESYGNFKIINFIIIWDLCFSVVGVDILWEITIFCYVHMWFFFLGITKECCILILISIMVMVLKKHFIPQIVSWQYHSISMVNIFQAQGTLG